MWRRFGVERGECFSKDAGRLEGEGGVLVAVSCSGAGDVPSRAKK